jgi:aldehyde dehydrogenase (NAD+)
VQLIDGVAEAIEDMNNTNFGLLACIWTNDLSRAIRVTKSVRAGQVSVNDFHTAGVIGYPFNMQRESGFGRGGGYEALYEYTQEKAVAIRLLP